MADRTRGTRAGRAEAVPTDGRGRIARAVRGGVRRLAYGAALVTAISSVWVYSRVGMWDRNEPPPQQAHGWGSPGEKAADGGPPRPAWATAVVGDG